MLRKVLKRILISIPVLVGVVLLIFIMLRIVPGDPVTTMMGEHVNPAVIEKISKEMGLDKPLYVQFLQYIAHALRGDFGTSYRLNRNVTKIILEAFPNTVKLSLLAAVVAWIIGIVAGIIAAVRQNKLLEALGRMLGLPQAPRRMESYDISNTGADDIVASMVVFADGRPLKRDYRRFQVKTLDHADDLRAMEEVLERRFRRYLEGDEHFAPLPDLLLMDGGQLQAEAACHVLERLGLTVPVLGMVKDDRHRTRALVTPQGQELGIQQSPPLFALVGRVQEEVHRFAITYHHEKHTKSALTSRLDGIPGVGDIRKKALLKHFRSVRAIEQAELLQLEAVLPKAAARAVYDHFHKEETP